MTDDRVLVIGLDGFELTYAQQLIDEGRLPVIAGRLRAGANVRLEHGPATRTGLAWEHFWSGASPEAARRAAAVELDGARYAAWAEGARFPPFFEGLAMSPLVFDTPYADLSLTPSTRGVVAWGCHDPGLTGAASNPPELVEALDARIGPYPAPEWMYRSPWPSGDATHAMADALVAGIEARGRATAWLFAEHVTDWDFGIVVSSELHSAAEGFWHGVDPTHPLHDHPAAGAASDALRDVYDAIDRFVGVVTDAVEADVVVLVSMNGMGANHSDVPTMALLPELVFRWATGRRLLEPPEAWRARPTAVPPARGDLGGFDRAWYPSLGPTHAPSRTQPLRRVAQLLPAPIHRAVSARRSGRRELGRAPGHQSIEWQPAAWYQPSWKDMRAFALPSFYDGRIRVNVRGREANGLVEPADYVAVCDELEALVRRCVNPRTGASVVASVERPGGDDPRSVVSSGADLVVVWEPGVFAFDHPQLGLIGPLPYRRTGGHTGRHGFASVAAPGVAPGDHGIAASFDVAPTLLDLAGHEPRTPSGVSVLDRLRSVPAP